jgi:hypothetical protein
VTTTFGYELVSVEQTKSRKLFELGKGVGGGGGGRVITDIPSFNEVSWESLAIFFESWWERFFSNCIHSVKLSARL